MDTVNTPTIDLDDEMAKGETFRARFVDGYATFKPEHDYAGDDSGRVVVCLWDVEFEARGGAVRGNLTVTHYDYHERERAVEALTILLGAACEITR